MSEHAKIFERNRLVILEMLQKCSTFAEYLHRYAFQFV